MKKISKQDNYRFLKKPENNTSIIKNFIENLCKVTNHLLENQGKITKLDKNYSRKTFFH